MTMIMVMIMVVRSTGAIPLSERCRSGGPGGGCDRSGQNITTGGGQEPLPVPIKNQKLPAARLHMEASV